MAKIPVVSLDVWKDLYAEAMSYESIKPWNILCEDSFFGVQDPASGHLGYGCVLGEMGTFLALAVYRGAEGFNTYQRLKNDEIPEDESFAAQNCLMAQFADREELEKADRDNIKKLGLRFRGVQAWPMFRSHLPGYFPWHLDEKEAVFLTCALRCASDWVERIASGRLDPDDHPGKVFTYLLKAGDEKPPRGFEVCWTDTPVYKPAPPQPLVLDEKRLTKLMSKPPKRGGAWEADVYSLPAPIMDRDRPYFIRMVMVVDRVSGFVLPGGVVPPEQPAHEVLADALLGGVEQLGCAPGEICVRDENLSALLEPLAKALGARLTVGDLPTIRRTKKEFDKMLMSRGARRQ
ncbi:MAG: hypothetical protein HYX59_04005 [Elusimicrobia bacterium]|nr:hypothetical protein [Elusimicrobiota bacterium]